MMSTIAACSAMSIAGCSGARRTAVPIRTRFVRRRDPGAELERLAEVAVLEQVVLGHPDRADPERLRPLDPFERAGVQLRPVTPPVGRVAQVVVEADSHALER